MICYSEVPICPYCHVCFRQWTYLVLCEEADLHNALYGYVFEEKKDPYKACPKKHCQEAEQASQREENRKKPQQRRELKERKSKGGSLRHN